MKNIFFLIIFTLNFINFSYADNNISCENIDKLSKEYVKCTIEKVKKLAKAKTKEIHKKYKSSETKKKYDKFKKTKNLKDLFKND